MVDVRSVPGLHGGLARVAAEYQYGALLRELKALEPSDWDAQTECDRWTVKDVIAHILGWEEATISFRELRHQVAQGIRRRKELGNALDALNEQQVEDRRPLSSSELIARLETTIPRVMRARMRLGKIGRAIPVYDPVVMGRSNLGYLFNVIFTRDVLMHRVDIARATKRSFEFADQDRVVLNDVIKDWARRTRADATVTLDGIGSLRAGTGARASITGAGTDFARVVTGRGSPEELTLSGDTDAARRWLRAGCPF